MSATIVIDLISDDDEEPSVAPAKRKAAAPAQEDYDSNCFIVDEQPAPAAGSSTDRAGSSTDRLERVNEEMEEEEEEDDDESVDDMSEEDECEECDRPAEQKRTDTAAGDEDEDVVFKAGRTGDLALSDFPHARENCASAPWKAGRLCL